MEGERNYKLGIKEKSPVALYSLYFIAGCLIGSVIIIHLSTIFFTLIIFILVILLRFLIFEDFSGNALIYYFKTTFFLLGLFGFSLQKSRAEYMCDNINCDLISIVIPILEKPVYKGQFYVVSSSLNNSAKLFTVRTKDNLFLQNISFGDTLKITVASNKLKIDDYGNYNLFIKKGDFKIKKIQNRKLLISLLLFRENISTIVDKKIAKSENREIFKALILGIKSGIPKRITNNYSTAGIMHMLAISGMHTGYIYSILLVLLSFLGKSKSALYIKTIIVLAFIWFYSILTGFSDSVIRSAFMISIHQITLILERGKISLNTIGITALVMIVLNPESIFNLGFQLSFMATLSIIMIYPLLYELLIIKNKLVNYFWQITSMSISGQTGTLLITIFTFGRFPVYFILGNILAAPVVVFIMILSFVSVFLIPIESISDFSFRFTEFGIIILNFIAKSIAELPFSNINW